MHGATYGKIHVIKQKLIKYVFNFFFRANARKIYARKRESWARFNFYVYARPSVYCL